MWPGSRVRMASSCWTASSVRPRASRHSTRAAATRVSSGRVRRHLVQIGQAFVQPAHEEFGLGEGKPDILIGRVEPQGVAKGFRGQLVPVDLHVDLADGLGPSGLVG